ncbi:MAG: ABC transporter substrate-binding protein [Alcaligenaceae bacterium]|nr:ABC transporter substrate-binding protein [Alcaligenaceae bacterium]
MDRRQFLLTSSASLAAMSLPGVSWAQRGKTVFRWVPQADLTLLDPTFTTAAVTQGHAQLVFDTLYGLDSQYMPHPQMAAGHSSENDGLLWKITLRDGLRFHDGSPVRAADAVASIKRWAKRDVMGRSLMQATEELSAPDDKTIQFKLSKPFPLIINTLARQSGLMAVIMPERLANLPETEGVQEMVGSGPFKFVADKWVSGSRVVYEKFADYQPRKDDMKPDFSAGPKVAHVDGVLWNIIPDRATAIAALQANEVDGVETVDTDFLPILRDDPNITLIKRSLPTIGVMRFNHLHAPFNNVEIRRAVLSVVNQTEYMTAINGADFPEFWSDKCGVFVPGSPMASDAGMEKLTGKRDIEKAKAAIKAAGYKGEKVVLLDPVDFPTWHAAALVTADLFKRLGFNLDVQAIDWGTAVQRRNSKEPVSNGGWSVAFTGNTGPDNLNPAGHLALRGNGEKAWFGWPTSEKIEKLRMDWLNTSDLETQKKICREIQLQVFEDVPYIPLGASYPVTALRKEWRDFQPQIALFYTVRKGA